MASPASAFSVCCSSASVRSSKPTMYSLSSSSHSCLKAKTVNFSLSSRFSQMGMSHCNPWNGLRHMGISISAKPQKLGSREKCKGMVVYASLFGVGAPELLVIGAVALMVFGPKGLADVARSLGKTLREFQPAIKELQEVSREFKNTLEKEIGLDDDPSALRNTNESSRSNVASIQSVSSLDDSQIASLADTNGTPPNDAYASEQKSNITKEQVNAAAPQDDTTSLPDSQIEVQGQPQDDVLPDSVNSSEDNLKITDEQPKVASEDDLKITEEQPKVASEDNLKITEEQPKVATAAQQDVASSPQESHIEFESQPQGATQETATAAPAVQKPESET